MTKRQNPKNYSKNAKPVLKPTRFEKILLRMGSDLNFVPNETDRETLGKIAIGLSRVDDRYCSRMLRWFGAYVVQARLGGKITFRGRLEDVLERNFNVLIRQCLIWSKGAKSKSIYFDKRLNRLVGPLPNAIRKSEHLLLKADKYLEQDPWDGINKRLIKDLNDLIDHARDFLHKLEAEFSYDRELSALELKTFEALSVDFGVPLAKELMSLSIDRSKDAGLTLEPRALKWERNRVGRLMRRRNIKLKNLKWEKNPDLEKYGLSSWQIR